VREVRKKYLKLVEKEVFKNKNVQPKLVHKKPPFSPEKPLKP